MNPIKKTIRSLSAAKLNIDSILSLAKIPHVKNLDKIYSKYKTTSSPAQNSSSLDIGCGTNPRNPFNANRLHGIDIRENIEQGIKYADLIVEPIPFEDNYFDFITAYDFLEHVPRIIYTPNRRFAFVELMNEIWRTLKQDGVFLSHTPIYPYSPVFRDPTHVNIITDETFPLYFDDVRRWASMYGFFGSFKIVDQVICGVHLISVLKKTMPA